MATKPEDEQTSQQTAQDDSIDQQSNTQPIETKCQVTVYESDGSNYGYTVLSNLCTKVISGLSREPKALGHALLGKGLLSREKVEEIVQIPATDTENARKIYNVVLGCVQHFPHRYRDFISVLKENSLLYGDLLSSLREAYNEADPSAQDHTNHTSPPSTGGEVEESTSSSTTDQQVISELTVKVDALENKFKLLVKQTLKRLQQADISIDKFYAQVSCMKHTLKRLAGKYVKESFKQADSLEALWGELNWFWDFFNFELLQHVIRELFSETKDPLLSQLAEYEDEMGRFLSATKLSDFFKVWPFSTDKPQEKEVMELKRVVVRVDRKWEDCTLHDVKNISSNFAQRFFLPREFLLLAGVGKSSVSLLWYVPPSLASSIKEKVRDKSDFLSGNGFLSITIDDLQLFDSGSYLKERVHKLESKFKALTSKTFHYLNDSLEVLDFYANVPNKDIDLKLKHTASEIMTTSSLAVLWEELNRFWDFFNFELFHHVAQVMHDDALLSEISDYIIEVDIFCASTKTCDFFQVWPFLNQKPQPNNLKHVAIQLDKLSEDCTLQDVKNISSTFAQGFSLPRKFLLLVGVDKSSVSLLWYVPPSLASSIEEKVRDKSDFLSDNGFLSITIDDLQVYPLTPMRQSSLHLKSLYEQRMNSVKAQKSKKIQMPFKLALISKEKYIQMDKYSLSTLHGDKDDIPYKKSPTNIESLGTLRYGSPARLVLLEGAPGSGKTTFCLDAVLKWMRNEILTDISLLALFPLRDYNLKKVTTLLELLALISPVPESLLKELEINKGEGVAFLFDGWDEIASSLDSLSPIFKQLVSGEILGKARVLVASRSWATPYIRMLLDRRPSQHIEIVSSARDQINWLLTLRKRELPTKFLSTLDEFLTYLEETPAIRGNMHTPLATDITLEVYRWSQESGSPLPTTVTQLYTSYTCLCIHKYLDNHSHFESKLWKSNDMRDIPEPLRTWLFSLCRLAFDGLEDGQRLVFPDVPNHLRLETLGLMQTQAPLYGSEESALVSYHYKHLTLQEFLTALLLSWISDEERREIVESRVSDSRFQIMLRCLSGLTKSPPVSRDHILRMLDSKEDKNKLQNELVKESNYKLTIFHWLFEGGDTAYTADILGEREMTVVSDYTWSSLDLFIVGHSIAHSKCAWNIYFVSSHLGDEKMTEFLRALGNADGEKGNSYITSIDWRENNLSSQSLCHLQDIPAHLLRHLKCFNISSNNLDRTAVGHIAETIPHMPQLEELYLRWNDDIQRGGTVSLVSALCDHKALKNLDFSGTNIGEKDCEQLAQLLSSSLRLEELSVRSNFLSSDSVHILFKGLQQNSSLKSIRVNDCSISLEAMKTLSAYLQDKKKCKLETLDLFMCNISSDIAIELAHGISRNCSVKELILSSNYHIGDEGAAALGQAMTENKTITKLELAGCGITSTGGAALASSLMFNSTIEVLQIGGNSLGGATPMFAQLLGLNQTLKRLLIWEDDSLSQSDVKTLLNSLTNNKTLEVLRLPKKFKVDTDKRVKWT